MLRRSPASLLRRSTTPSAAFSTTITPTTCKPSSLPPLSDTDRFHARSIAAIISSNSNSSSSLSTALSNISSSLTEQSLLRAFDLLRLPSTALLLFRSLSDTSNKLSFPLSDRIAHKTLQILCRCRSLSLANEFLNSLAPPIHDRFFNTLIRAQAAAGNLRDAINLFSSMPSPPSVYSFNSLIAALLRRGRTRAAAKLYARMKDTGVTPDVCTFNTLIRGFCLNSMVDEGFFIFKEMQRVGCDPDVITYNTLIDGLCRTGKVKTAHNLFDGMRNVKPNVVSYTTLIRGYGSKMQAEEAVGLFQDMVAAGLKPNKVTCNTLIQGFCEARRMDLVKQIMELAGEGGDVFHFKPDTCTFNTLIAAHCNSCNVGAASKVFDRMAAMRVKPDSASYGILIRGLCQSGEFERAEELVDEILDKDVLGKRGGCVPLMATYNLVFKYLCKNGKADKAGRLIRKLLEKRAAVDIVAFKTSIIGHCSDGQPRKGYELLVSMVRQDLKPDFKTFEALLNKFLEIGKMGFAWKSLQYMVGSGHRPSTKTFHVVLAGLVEKEGHVDDAAELLEVMLERNIRQNVELSTLLVVNLFRNSRDDRAFKVLCLLYEHGYSVKMEVLVAFLCQIEKFMEAQKLLLFCHNNSHYLDSKFYNMVISSLCSAERPLDAFAVFYEFIEKGSTSVTLACLKDLKHVLEIAGNMKEAEFVSKRINTNSVKIESS